MNKILVATDFSDAAKNAATYALHVAKYFNASLELIHSFDVPFTFAESGIQYLDIEELERNTKDALHNETKRLEKIDENIGVSYRSCIGRIYDCLNDIVERENPLLIVFGMSGETDTFLWGSTAVSALRSFDAPVLIVPKNAEWKGVQNVCYAVNYKKLHDSTPYEKVVDWSKKLSDKLTVFNVYQPNNYTEPPQKLKQALANVHTDYVSFESENFEQGIQDFLSKNDFNWLIIIPQKHGFFDRLMHDSRSKQIARVSSIPVLSFYEK